MSKLYCQSCFQPTEYVGTKPSFCSSCGNPFSKVNLPATANVPSPPKPSPKPPKSQPVNQPKYSWQQKMAERQGRDQDDDDNEDNDYTDGEYNQFDIPKLSFIPLGNLRNRQDLSSLAMDQTPKQDINRPKPKKVSSKKAWQEFHDEVVGIRQGNKPQSKEIGE